jgi:transcription elongation factor GreA
MTTAVRSSADLLRDVGLLADGPVRWGRPVPARGAGIYLIELGDALPAAPIELTKVGKWLERLPGLRLDGERPTSKALAARLASLWLPEARLLYAGASTASIGGRVASLQAHVLGDRRPHADGQWLHALRKLDGLRIWWASTKAPEESLDAIFDAFAATSPSGLPGRPAAAIVLPWANMRRPTGERQAHGITGAIAPDDSPAAPPATRRVELAPGDADGATRETKGSGTVRRTNAAPPSARASRSASAAPAARPARLSARQKAEPKREGIPLTADAIERLREELDQLTRVRRPEVVLRIKTAREHGDLKENAEYHAAREEQSFLEGRIRLIEDRLRYAVVIDDVVTGRVALGSVVAVEVGGEELTWTIVGTAEADPKSGRISTASPVGAALLGAVAGDEIEVRTPRGPIRYRIVTIS